MSLRGGEVLARDLSRRFQDGGRSLEVLRHVNLSVSHGGSVAIVGASGSGKSTLLHLLGGIDVPSEGSIEVGGISLGELTPRERASYRRKVGFVFQRFHLISSLTVLENVAMALLPMTRGKEARVRSLEALERVGLATRSESMPRRLSGGEQQRVAIARAIVGRPALLLADEPTGNLDRATAEEVLELVFALQRDLGTTCVLVTHDAAVAAHCERTLELIDGTPVLVSRGSSQSAPTAAPRP